MQGREDTIAALATAPGRAAVAVVRLSGSRALDIARALTGRGAPRPRQAELCTFRDPAGVPIDRGLLLFFPGPRSYTGEDVVELHTHGGEVVTDWLLASAYSLGARPATPGEFTLRAFLNDKLDLTQAEAVADLVDSGSREAARAALRSLRGAFSTRVQALQEGLTDVRVQTEAWLDFPDEELDLDAVEGLAARVDALLEQGAALLEETRRGAVLRDGLHVVIAGAPNVGKSSLMNRLAGYDAAIVTPIPGTTRDPLREQLSLDGLPVSIVDTAGLRSSPDLVEAEGVRRAQRELERADLVLWVADAREALSDSLAAARRELGAAAGFALVRNKIDLAGTAPGCTEEERHTVLHISALTGAGVDRLVEHLRAQVGWTGEVGGTFTARSRHLDALGRCGRHLERARAELDGALEVAAEELKGAQAALSELTGERNADDLLGEIFARFCIGK